MRKNKGLLVGILIALVAFSTMITMIGALIAMEFAHNTSDIIDQLFDFTSDITLHVVTDLIFLGMTGIGYLFSLRKIRNETFSFVILLAFMTAIFVFGSDLLVQFEAMKVEKLDGQFGLYIFDKVTYTGILYPVVGFIYDRYRRPNYL